MMPELLVVDLSHHNTVTDFGAAEAAGVVGIIHKATEGTSFIDSDYHQREFDADEAGLAWASYHFLKHGRVVEQISHYLSFADPVPGARVCIDYEDEACTLDDLHQAIDAIQDIDPSLQICIYGGHLLKQHLGSFHDPALAPHALWIAQYNSSGPEWPRGTWPVWTLWQFSDGDQGGSPRDVPGISAPHDCNAFNGSRENCRKWFGPPDIVPIPPEPHPEIPVVEMDIRVPENVTLVISVNGLALDV